MSMVNKIECASCGDHLYVAEATNTIMGNLCKGCYNLFLVFRLNSTKRMAQKSFWLYLLPSLFVYFVHYQMTNPDLTQDTLETYFWIIGIWAGIGAYRLVKNGFTEVGDTVKKNYYQAYVHSEDDITVSERSYNTYSSDQWFKIGFNLVLFAIGFVATCYAGPLIYLSKKLAYRKAKKNYDLYYDENLDASATRISQDVLSSYSGLIAQKALDLEANNTSIIQGVEVLHVGYLFHDGDLYAAFGTEDENPVFDTETFYFMKLFSRSNDYEVIDCETNLYQELYSNFKTLFEQK